MTLRILTFDLEDWFHLLDFSGTRTEREWNRYPSRLPALCDRLLNELERRGQKATFFCLGWVARRHPHLVRRIHEAGHEIASHSDHHQLAYEQTPEEFSEDLKRSIDVLQQATGARVRAYRAPGFSLTPRNLWAWEVLVAHGIEIDCSIFPAHRAHGGFPEFGAAAPVWLEVNGVRIKEFPINSYSLGPWSWMFSGGGYFRLTPYRLLRRWMRSSRYVMTYFHPRDFDAEQPRIDGLTPWRRFRAYVGLRGAWLKFQRLLDEFEFVDLATAEDQVDWSQAPVVRLRRPTLRRTRDG